MLTKEQIRSNALELAEHVRKHASGELSPRTVQTALGELAGAIELLVDLSVEQDRELAQLKERMRAS